MLKADTAVRQDVYHALAISAHVRAEDIALAIKDGVISVFGAVATHAEKVAVEQVVRHVEGVRGLALQIDVNPPENHRTTDAELVLAALDALSWNVLVPAGKVQVKAEQAWITLGGDVSWHFEREAAEVAVRGVKGARGVTNRILVVSDFAESDVRERIAREFSRRASQDARSVAVSIDGTRVLLTGVVSSWAEFDDAERAARAMPGVTDVSNLIDVVERGAPAPDPN